MIAIIQLIVLESLFSVENLIQFAVMIAFIFIKMGKFEEKQKALDLRLEKIESQNEKIENTLNNFLLLQKDIEYIKMTDNQQNERLAIIEKSLESIRLDTHYTKGSLSGIQQLLENVLKDK